MPAQNSNDLVKVVLAHVTSVLLPVLGPLAILLSVRRDRWARSHARVALFVSAAGMAAASLISWMRNRSMTGMRQGEGPIVWDLLMAASFGGVLVVAVLNIGRAKGTRGPVGCRSA